MKRLIRLLYPVYSTSSSFLCGKLIIIFALRRSTPTPLQSNTFFILPLITPFSHLLYLSPTALLPRTFQECSIIHLGLRFGSFVSGMLFPQTSLAYYPSSPSSLCSDVTVSNTPTLTTSLLLPPFLPHPGKSSSYFFFSMVLIAKILIIHFFTSLHVLCFLSVSFHKNVWATMVGTFVLFNDLF